MPIAPAPIPGTGIIQCKSNQTLPTGVSLSVYLYSIPTQSFPEGEFLGSYPMVAAGTTPVYPYGSATAYRTAAISASTLAYTKVMEVWVVNPIGGKVETTARATVDPFEYAGDKIYDMQ